MAGIKNWEVVKDYAEDVGFTVVQRRYEVERSQFGPAGCYGYPTGYDVREMASGALVTRCKNVAELHEFIRSVRQHGLGKPDAA